MLLWFFVTQFLFLADGDDSGGSGDGGGSSDDSGDKGGSDDSSDDNGDDSGADDKGDSNSDDDGTNSALDGLGDGDKGDEEIEEYTLELGEESNFVKEDLEGFVTEAEELGLTKAQAEKLLKSREDLYSKASKNVTTSREEEQNTLRESLLNDAEFGGDKFEASTKIMSLPVAQFGDQDFKDMLKGDVGNQPALARFLFKLGNAMKSDTFVGKGKTSDAPKQKTQLEKLYPSFYEKK